MNENEEKSAVDNELASLLEGGEADVNLSDLQTLVDQLLGKLAEKEALDAQAKVLAAEIDRYKSKLIPDAMGGLKQIKTQSGATVSVKEIIRASLPKDTKPAAIEWLEEHGHGGLIKTEVSVSLSREERELAPKAIEALKAQGFAAEVNADVHPMTLSAWAREQLEQGAELPAELISIFQGKTVEVRNAR